MQLVRHVQPREVPSQHGYRSGRTALSPGIVHLEGRGSAGRIGHSRWARWRRRCHFALWGLGFDWDPIQDLAARRSGGLKDGKPLTLILEEADNLLVGRRQ